MDLDKSLRSFSEGEDSVGLTAKTTLGAVKEHIDDGLSDILSSNGLDCNFEHADFVLKDDMKNVASPVNLDVETSPGNYLPHAGIDEDKSEPGGEVENGCLEGSEAKGDNNCNDFNIKFPCVPDVDASSQILEVHNRDDIDSYECYGYFGDWSAYWDSFYMRYYFYNIKTHESTWYPPPGMEHSASGDIPTESNGTVADVTSKDDSLAVSCYTEPTDLHGLHRTNSFEETTNEGKLSDQPLDELLVGIERADDNSVSSRTIHCVSSSFEHEGVPHNVSKGCKDETSSCLLPDTQEIISSLTNTITKKVPDENSVVAIKRKKKVRRVRSQRKLSIDFEELQLQGISEEFSVSLSKYWCQRYQLFSRFDDGIKMDEEGWYSVTPERLARHHASRCGSGIIVDCFTGVGGNAIQFAQRSKHVIAIDIDSVRIGYAQHNAVIYEVEDRIDFMIGDFFLLAPNLKADTVFLSPPWGGPDYVKVETYDIKTMLEPQDGYSLFNVAKEVASRIVMFLPRNVDVNQIAELALSANPPWSVEVEKNFLNGKFKAITAYFSVTRV